MCGELFYLTGTSLVLEVHSHRKAQDKHYVTGTKAEAHYWQAFSSYDFEKFAALFKMLSLRLRCAPSMPQLPFGFTRDGAA